ncbi:DNA-directed RNA polymerase II 14.5 kDa polypeptide [Panicum miliaceum]|uniref:DNA-directed RNA polymerase II 14.5 kDa polypeptide n=1 Tax=Panicum miliaceum TaxID=4540 RepID=A0A3L6QDB7_PANMI|nr:DNA-directed RNA polymerase II 14.5 kDa polypeptide [Panicum miliaceum]
MAGAGRLPRRRALRPRGRPSGGGATGGGPSPATQGPWLREDATAASMSTMKFCRECNNILYPKEDRDRRTLFFACRNCEHQEVSDNNCVYRNEVHHTAGERTQVLQDVASDPTLPRTKTVRCALCGHGEAVFFQLDIASLIFLLFLSRAESFIYIPDINMSSATGYGKRGGGDDPVLCVLQP